MAVPAGSIFGLLGPNGAGKTSTIRMIMNITAPDSGEVVVFGHPRTSDDLRRIGYLPEERGLYRKMTVMDQLVFLGEIRGLRGADADRRHPALARAGRPHQVGEVEDRGAVQGHAAEGAAHRHRAPHARPPDPRRAVLRPRSHQPGALPRPAARLPVAGQERRPLHPRHGARRADVRPHLPDLRRPRRARRRAEGDQAPDRRQRLPAGGRRRSRSGCGRCRRWSRRSCRTASPS